MRIVVSRSSSSFWKNYVPDLLAALVRDGRVVDLEVDALDEGLVEGTDAVSC